MKLSLFSFLVVTLLVPNLVFGQAVQSAGKVKTVVLDKTGTITKGEPEVTDVICVDDVSEKTLVNYAYSLEKTSEHPLAKAVVRYAENNCFDFAEFFKNSLR